MPQAPHSSRSANYLDDAPHSRFHTRLTLQCSGGPFLDGYALSIIGVAMAGMTADLRLSEVSAGLVGAAALIGILVGGLVFGPVTDRVGREVMYTIDLVVLVVASVLCAFVTDGWQLIVLRFVLGLSVGADYPIATTLLAEWLPRDSRAKMLGVTITFWYLGAMMAYFVGYAMVQLWGPDQWRWILASAAVPGLVTVLARIGTPESPRWLISKGRVEDARRVVRRVFGADVPLTWITEGSDDADAGIGLRQLFRGGYGGRTLFCGFFYLAQVTPLFAIYTFGPAILAAFGLTSGNASNLVSAVISLVFVIGCLPALRWVENRGRRPVIVWSFAAMLVPFALLGIFPSGPIWFVIACLCAYALFSGGPTVLEWTYPNELFPTSVRASAVGLATAISRLGAAAGTYLLPVGLDRLGIGRTMLIGAALTLLGWLACLLWAPETKGRALSETSAPRTG
ncbi:MAG: MFS transporter [Kutzneria sp.]|nr:MFS transporter [Kutzneria sp.]